MTMVSSDWFLADGGDMGRRMRALDWTASPLGDPATWPETLRSNVSLMLSSGFPTLILWGPDHGLLYNDAYSIILDGKHPSALGRPFATVWPEVWQDLAPLIARSMAGEAIFIEDMQLHLERKGYPKESYFTFFYSPLRMESGRIGGITCGCIETTEKVNKSKQANDLLVDRSDYWNFARELIAVMDYQGVFIDVSAAWEKILGWSRDEMVGRSYAGFIHPDDLPRSNERADALFADGMTIDRFENRYLHKDGGYRWLSWTGASARGRFYASAHDVTAEKAQAETLRQSEARASTYFDFSEDYLFLIRVDADGVASFEDMNVATERVMGLSRARVKGKAVALAVPADSAADITKHALACLETGEPQRYLASRRYQGGQATTLIEGRVAFVERFEAGGGLVLFSGSDVTEQRGIEEALRQSQKMEAVGQLTGGLAHDFNNLLAVVTGNLELMALRLGKGRFNDLERFMASAQAASKRATALTHRLLSFSRRQTLDPSAIDINMLVEDMRELVNRTVGPEITVAFVGAPALWTTFVDPNQLENALLNLCINARDAMPDGGKLTVETSNQDLGPGIAAVRDLPPGQYVALSVSDTGTGMSPELIERVFEPFFTTKPTGQGTGLGLSMVYGFARQSEGQVRIHSEVGRGTTVTIYLPRSDKAATADSIELVATPQQAERGRTILVVDDEAAVRMLISDVLRDLGYGIIEAQDGPAALKILQSHDRVDLLITDVGMPGMNGRQLADAARVSRPHLKTLFITGYAEASVVSHGHLDADMAIMTKPFALDVLANRVKGMIDGEGQG